MEENELIFKRPINEQDLEEIQKRSPSKIVLNNTKGQDYKLIAKIPENISIVIRNEINGFETDRTYTPMELSEYINRLDQLDDCLSRNWSNLEKATYLYTALMSSEENNASSLKDVQISYIGKLNDDGERFAFLFKEEMDRNNIPCRIIKSNEGYYFNEIKIGSKYYPLDLRLDRQENYKRIKDDGSFELKHFLSDKEFYDQKEHLVDEKTEVSRNALDHSYIQDAIDTVFGMKDKRKVEDIPPITIKSKELKGVFKSGEIKDSKDIESISKLRVDFIDNDTGLLKSDLEEIGKYYPQTFNNVVLANNTKQYINMQGIIDTIYESRENQEITQKVVEPIHLVIESNSEKDFDLDFTKVPAVKIDTLNPTEGIDTNNSLSFVNTSGNQMKMPKLTGKISNNINSIEITDFNLDNFNFSQSFMNANGYLDPNSVLSNVKELTLSGNGISGVGNLSGLDDIIKLTINNIPENEFNDVISISVGNPTRMNRLFNLSILNQGGVANRKIFEEIKNPNIIRLGIFNSRMNDISGINGLKNQLLFMNLQSNDLSIDQCKEIITCSSNSPCKDVYISNDNLLNTIDNIGGDVISDETYNYLDSYFKRTGQVNYSGLTYNSIASTDINDRKKEMLKNFTNFGMKNVPYFVEDAKIFRETLPFVFNPMMIKDVDTFKRYLNDSSNYFEQNHLKDGILLLTKEQLEALINSGKKISQNINLRIDTVKDLDNAALDNFKQRCDNIGLKLIGVRVFDCRQKNQANINERVFDGYDTNIVEYSIDEYKEIRKALEDVVNGIDTNSSDVEKFAIVYKRLSDLIATYDTLECGVAYSKEHALYQNKNVNTSRNLLEGLIKTEGFDLTTNSSDLTLKNKCVCVGYADILKNALDMVGVDAIMEGGNTTKDPNNPGGHRWNKVKIDGKWYYADLCWDNGGNIRNNKYNYALRGNRNDTFVESGFTYNCHLTRITPGERSEICEDDPYDQNILQDLFDKIRDGEIPAKIVEPDIVIPDDPVIEAQIDEERVKEEYIIRKNDMYAKFYGDKKYREEYKVRATRYREHEINANDGTIEYKTVEDYQEKKEDEKFLLLDKYQEALERVTRYDAGDHSVYTGTADQIETALKRDREYVETRNYTFDQNRATQKDLATLGKYGERMPYIQRQNSVVKNIGRGILNTGIFVRNMIAPVYRVAGRFIAQPLHRLRTRNRDASPYRNNIYHRMIARRDYFLDVARQRDTEETERRRNEATDPTTVKEVSHSLRNSLESKIRAVTNAREGNEAVLRAGAYDIRQNIIEQENDAALLRTLILRRDELRNQVNQLEQEKNAHPNAGNIKEVMAQMIRKNLRIMDIEEAIDSIVQRGKIGNIQTDAINQEQHAIASKEINTAKVTAIKGVAKIVTAKFIGPNIKNWLLERGKTVEQVDVTVPKTVQDNKWISPVIENVPETKVEKILDKSKTLKDIMEENSGKKVSGFYSVWGGEKGASSYTLTGSEKITAIFKATKDGGVGLSDKAGLTAPVFTDGVFKDGLLDATGTLSQDISIETLIGGIEKGTIDINSISDMYLSIGDNYWVKATDILANATKEVSTATGKMITKVVTPGHWNIGTKVINEVVKTTKVVDNPVLQKVVNGGKKAVKGIFGVDTVQNVVENVRNTTTNQKSNKSSNRHYTYDDGENTEIPTSKKEYDER